MNTTKLACGMMIGLCLAACSASSEADGVEGQSGANATDGTVPVGGARDLRATNNESLWMLSGLWQRRSIATSSGLDLAVFQVGGADADINSNSAWVTVGRGNKTAAFDLGMMIQTVDTGEMTLPDVVHLAGTSVTISDKGEVVPEKWEATVKLGVQPGDAVTLTRDGRTTSIAAATDAGARFLPSVRAVHTAEGAASDAFVRVFESAAPGATAHRLMVSIMALPEEQTFDLGVDVKTVTKVASPKDGLLTIEGTDAASRPVVYSLTYKVDEETGPSTTAKITRVR